MAGLESRIMRMEINRDDASSKVRYWSERAGYYSREVEDLRYLREKYG